MRGPMANQTPLRITIVGAGPAGLYTAILARRHLGNARVEVIEQNARGSTFGFGVVFSDKALEGLARVIFTKSATRRQREQMVEFR